MTTIEVIKEKLAYVGVITDIGASSFACDNGIEVKEEVTQEEVNRIGQMADAFVDKYIMRPSSVSEAGFSMSWSAEQIKNHAQLMFAKYGITPNKNVTSALGLSVIRDVSNIW